LYEEYGVGCLELLRGMFAFAIWDEKKQQLFAARDRAGKKPFYYAETPSGLYFASEIQALYAIDGYDRSLDYAALDLYVSLSYIPSPHTILKGIRKLPAAYSLIYNSTGLHTERYWQLKFGPKLSISYDDACHELMTQLEDATRIRLFSDVPLGCFLSGGIDSSTIVAIMARVSSSPVKTFSIGFPDNEYDETSYAAQLATYYNTDHQTFTVTPNAVEVLPDLVRHCGEPFADSSALPTWYLAEMTRRHVTVALNGDGGDELFAGYNWYGTSTLLYKLKRFTPALAAHLVSAILGDRPKNSPLRRYARLAELLGKKDSALFADLRCEISSRVRSTLYSGNFRHRLESSAEQYLERLFDDEPSHDILDKMLATDSCSYLPEELMFKVDRMTMAHSLEGRSPFLDHKLMEFAAILPSSYKLHNGVSKRILRDVANKLVPPGFFERPKMGFSVPLRKWFSGDLAGYAQERIMYGPLRKIPLFDMTIVEQTLQGHGKDGNDFSPLIWRLLVLSEWLSQYSKVYDV
jgi:asparagine synthase (glutamine-hydrolysing)